MRKKGEVNIGKRYTKEERAQVLKLAKEIGRAAVTRRLGINEDTLYGWRVLERKRTAALEQTVGERSEVELMGEITQLQQA